MIAMAIACNPKLLIADEPTTALDVTIQAQILDLLLDLQRERGMALILITHDMGVVAETVDRVVVQYAGQQVEAQSVAGLFADAMHPYTAALLAALPERSAARLLPTIPGVVPGVLDRPTGCLFNPRCAFATDHCRARPAGLPRRPARPGPLPLPADRRRARRPSRPAGAGGMSAPSASSPPRGWSAATGSAAGCSRRRARSRRCAASASPSTAAARWPWSANPAAARARSPAWSP